MANFDRPTKNALLAFCVLAVAVGAFGVWLGHNDPGQLDLATKVAQLIFWFSAVAVGAFGIWKHFHENGERRTWEKAKLAKELLDDLNANPSALNATYMLGGWQGRWYERQENGQLVRFQATQKQIADVLDPKRTPMTDNENYVRDCYDNFLFHLELCFASVDSKLIDWDALEPMLVPLFADINRSLLLQPLEAYASFLGYRRVCARLPNLVEAALTKTPA